MKNKLADNLDYTNVQNRGGNQFCDSAALERRRVVPYVSEQEYVRGLKTFVVACVDVLFYYLDHSGMPFVFLPLRARKPQPGRWVVGGRRKPYTLLEEAAKAKVEIETSLIIDENRFQPIPGQFEYMWAESEHGVGLHASAKLMACELTPEECQNIRLNGEYDTEARNCWFSLGEALDPTHNIHPALRAMLLAFHDRNSNMVHQHSDARRTIYEAVHELDSGLVARTTVITVLDDNVKLGNHYHHNDKHFTVLAGSGELLLAPAKDRTNVTRLTFGAGETITVLAHTVHTFICSADTVLVAVTNWKFYEDAIIKA